MYYKGCFFMLFCLSWIAQAQFNDSLVLTNNSYHQEKVEQLYKHPLLYHHYSLENFTQTGVNFTHKELNFKRVQTPQKTQTFNFNTVGLFALSEKLRVFGRFDFDRVDEYDLGYTLNLHRTENQAVLDPHYFFAPQKGDWENQIFNITGGLSYQLGKSWLLGAVIRYKNHNGYRIVDPRPKITLADYSAKAFIGYQFKKHLFSFHAGLGRATTTGGIMYVDDAQNAPVYTETFTRFSSGYGRIQFNSTYPNYLEKEHPIYYGLGYQYNFNKSALSFTYNYVEKVKDFYNRDADDNVYFEEALVSYKYKKVLHDFQLLYDKDGARIDYQLQLNYQEEQGDNFAVVDQGQNYRHTGRELTLNSRWVRLEKKRLQWQIEATAQYKAFQEVDLLGYTDKEISSFNLQVGWKRDLFYTEKQVFNLGLALSSYLNVNEKLDVQQVTSDDSFTQQVILPDHAYDVTQHIGVNVNANHTFSLANHKSLRFFAQYKMRTPLGDAYQKYMPSLSTKQTSIFNLGMTLFY